MKYRLLAVVCILFSFQNCSLAKAQENESANQPADSSERLSIGSKAPPLKIEHWISDANGQRGALKEFEPGHVYLIEFWGTW